MWSEVHPDLSVSMLVHGEPLYEYDDSESDDQAEETKCRYVEAEVGSNFTVEIRSHQRMTRDRRDQLCCYIFLDGEQIIGRVIDLGGHSRPGAMINCFEGLEQSTKGGTVMRKFAFAQLETNEGPVCNARKEDFKHLGEVTVKCHWVHKTGFVSTKGYTYTPTSASSVAEKCLKGRAISNRATLGSAEVLSNPARNAVAITYPYGIEAFAIFTFKYRSRRDLQIEGIIARDPSPVPLEERDVATLTREEAIELLTRRNRQPGPPTQVKREMKRERSSTALEDDSDLEITDSRSKRRRVSDDSALEIVDLTED